MSLQLHEFRIPFAGVERTVIYHFSDLHLAVADGDSTPDEIAATQQATREFHNCRCWFADHCHEPFDEDISAQGYFEEILAACGTTPVRDGAKMVDLLRRPQVTYAALAPVDPDRPALEPLVTEQLEVELKYEGYIKRQLEEVKRFAKMEEKQIPKDLDFHAIGGLRLEARQKLSDLRPDTVGKASRIPGVSPADISVLLVALAQRGYHDEA